MMITTTSHWSFPKSVKANGTASVRPALRPGAHVRRQDPREAEREYRGRLYRSPDVNPACRIIPERNQISGSGKSTGNKSLLMSPSWVAPAPRGDCHERSNCLASAASIHKICRRHWVVYLHRPILRNGFASVAVGTDCRSIHSRRMVLISGSKCDH
jgi:hypothetical protein